MTTACAGRLTPQASVDVHTSTFIKPSAKYFSTRFLKEKVKIFQHYFPLHYMMHYSIEEPISNFYLFFSFNSYSRKLMR